MTDLFTFALNVSIAEAERLTKEELDDEPFRFVPEKPSDANHELFLFDREQARAINSGAW